MNKQFDKMAAFAVFEGVEQQVGIADVDLPDLDYMNDKISGAGIAGEVEMPTIGHMTSMKTKISWRTINKNAVKLSTPETHDLVFRGAQQVMNTSTGEIEIERIRINIRCMPRKTSLGKMDINKKTDTDNEVETLYLKLEIDGEKLIEIDKFNYICYIYGKDYLEDIRAALYD